MDCGGRTHGWTRSYTWQCILASRLQGTARMSNSRMRNCRKRHFVLLGAAIRFDSAALPLSLRTLRTLNTVISGVGHAISLFALAINVHAPQLFLLRPAQVPERLPHVSAETPVVARRLREDAREHARAAVADEVVPVLRCARSASCISKILLSHTRNQIKSN